MADTLLSIGASGDNVALLHSALQQHGLAVPAAESTQKTYGSGTQQAVQQFQQKNGLPATGAVDAQTAARLAALAGAGVGSSVGSGIGAAAGGGVVKRPPVSGGGGGGAPDDATVHGSLVFDNGLPAADLPLRLYRIAFGGQDVMLMEARSDAAGNYTISYPSAAGVLNLQMRAVSAAGAEVIVSTTRYNCSRSEIFNLIVPANILPLAPEFQRLSTAMETAIGGIGKLSGAQEGSARQDLTLLTSATHWDARLTALAAMAAQRAAATGLGQDLLYALFRVGLPSDPSLLSMVPAGTVQKALAKASQAGIVNLNEAQIAAATTAFTAFSNKARLALVAPGAVSSFGDLLATTLPDVQQQTAFANLYFSHSGSGAELWAQAAALGIPAQTLDALKLQGKFLHLTVNNAPLAQKLQQDIGTFANLPQLADKDYHEPATWSAALQGLVSNGDDQALQKMIPASYQGKTTADRLTAYSADLARKVRFSFPTQVTARLIEKKQLALPGDTGSKVSAFLRAAAGQGYALGRTPLNAFINSASGTIPLLDTASSQSLKSLHRLFQVTPSNESLQAALKLGFTSAYHIAASSEAQFFNQYAAAFPSAGEASLVYRKAQQVTSVTFNAFTMAKQMDAAPPIYALSASGSDKQNAKNAIVQQFPNMSSLFGSLDFCQCEECRSVLSPAAYFVDLLEYLRQSAPNAGGYTPLDVLIGKDGTVTGRRPDLGALPLTCENTNTALPYIDLVNEILEYYIANSQLDANAAYDTGDASSADLAAEPQHTLPLVYNDPLKHAVYPLNLPFDLWTESVRGFLGYFKIPLAQLLETLRPLDKLELFGDVNGFPWYRAQILAESLNLSPTEYQVLTVTEPLAPNPSVLNWFKLYGYKDEATAMNGEPDPIDIGQYLTAPLKVAKNLSQRLGLTYQEIADLATTGFINPGLSPLIFQFRRFGIDSGDAFSYTGQPGFPALSAQQTADFEAALAAVTARYKKINPASVFDAKAWLLNLLPANYAKKVLVLYDPDTGCNFNGTSLQYADGSAATQTDFLKLNLFVRLWKKTGWPLDEIDRALQLFFPAAGLPAWSDPGFAVAFSNGWKTALVYLAHLEHLNNRLAPAAGRNALLPLWSDLATQGNAALYAQLFMTPGVLDGDWAFDDPAGIFPWPGGDTLAAHQGTVQGVLGLTAAEVAAILADAGVAAPAGFTLGNLSLCYRYSLLAQCLQLPVSDLISLKQLSGLDPFPKPAATPLSKQADDLLYNQTILFIRQVDAVQGSGFSVADLQYLLREQLDPLGPYQQDQNALVALLQTMAGGLRQIHVQNTAPLNLTAMPDSQIDQALSALFPAPLLKTLFSLLSNTQSFTATQGGVALANAIDPAPFSKEAALAFAYDPVSQTQSLSYRGLLPDWKKAQLALINATPLFSGLLDGIQQQAQAAFTQRLADILGVWASLAQYEAVKIPVAAAIPAAPLMKVSPSISLSYDQSAKLQSVAYRGVLTDAVKSALLTVNNSSDLDSLLNDIQQQTHGAYTALTGNLLGMLSSVQTYSASQAGVALANRIDPGLFTSWPQLQLSYDPSSQTQTVSYQGVLSGAVSAALAALAPSSAVLPGLLAALRYQAVQLFQALAGSYMTVAAADVETYSAPFQGLTVAAMQKQVKAELVMAFLPLREQKLSRQLILQTLAADLAADLALTETLVGDAALLADPSNPGKALLGTFLATAHQGVSASYYAAADQSGPVLAAATAAAVDTADASNPNANRAGTGSVRFEGYLQVASDGPYRLFAELGDLNAQVRVQLDAPDPAGFFSNPVLQATAGKAGDEASQYVLLKGGVAYHFSVDLMQLGANGARLLIQGENLAKGPLSQILLYPQQAMLAFARARRLLAKVLQIAATFGLGQREISYLIANSTQFGNLKLSALPTQAADDTLLNARALFGQFLVLADYADLRKGPSGGADGLIGVFNNVGVAYSEAVASNDANLNSATPWTSLANLTRRDPQTVRALASYFGLIQETVSGPYRQVTAVGDFANNKGVRRLWQALQAQQIVGIPVAALTAATRIVSLAPGVAPAPDAIAGNLKNAVRARYTANAWRPVAQSIFDKLRDKKRDALVAYLLHQLNLDNRNQLFEYFLIDPGMEPVVQTSRLRLALSSVQTFIQRCLLDLENGNAANANRNVAPSALDGDWWEWMKRYRVWQANREIFLFPENWMEPELRLDKTDLFQAMEGLLLQGDVTSDLADTAFLGYLQGLDVIARLDVVATYLEQNLTDPGISTLHVLARSYGKPHKYFYRTFSCGSWSAWMAVKPDIDSDHIVLAVWRGRLNVFWLTFITKVKAKSQPAGDTGGPVTSMTFGGLADNIISASSPQSMLQVQLNWSEYYQGKWSERQSSDVNRYNPENPFPVPTGDGFDPNADIYIHVSTEVDNTGNEGAVRIHLDMTKLQQFYAFRVTSKNSDPDFGHSYWQSAANLPYMAPGVDATLHTGSGSLTVGYESLIGQQEIEETIEGVLQTVNGFALLTCGNPVAPPFLDPTDPRYQEAGGLVSPFFYKDRTGGVANSELTFFVQPTLTEQTISTWEGWALQPSQPARHWNDAAILDQIKLVAQVPVTGVAPVNPGDPQSSVYAMQSLSDWVTHPTTVVSFGGTLVGQAGAVAAVNAASAGNIAAGIGAAAAGGGVAAGRAGGSNGYSRSGQLAVQGMTLVSEQGLNLSNLQQAQGLAQMRSAP